MKKIYLSIVVTLISFPAFSKCFDFVSNGSAAVGLASFEGNVASKVCHYKLSNKAGRENDVLEFSDSEGVIMEVTVEVKTARCYVYCKNFRGLSGQVLGRNLTPEEVASVDVTISESGGWKYEDITNNETLLVEQSTSKHD